MSKSISVMVACFNEESTLGQAVHEALEALEPWSGDHEVVIVDDGSTDSSGAIADELEAEYDILRVVHHPRNLGLGGFYRTAFKEAKRDLVYFMAADLQPVPGEYFPKYLPLLETYHGVVGYDPHREAPLLSRLLSTGEKLLFKILYPGVPKIGGPLMLRRSLIETFDLVLADEEDRSWMVLWELMIRARRRGYRFASVPIRGRPRARGATKGSTIRTAVIMLGSFRELRKALSES